MILLGFDFDNTLICYDELFHKVALDSGLISTNVLRHKNAVRDSMCGRGLEDEWTRLQGYVYGKRIMEADPYPWMLGTIKKLADKNVPMCIVSHKTRTPYLGESYNLHFAARAWLQKQGFLDTKGFSWSDDQVFFELTKQEKIARIIELGCTHFVDDLPEILDMLPPHVEKILFAPSQEVQSLPSWKRMTSWQELPAILGF